MGQDRSPALDPEDDVVALAQPERLTDRSGAGLLRESAEQRGVGMANPVVHFEIGAADDQQLLRFYEELFGWGLQAFPG